MQISSLSIRSKIALACGTLLIAPFAAMGIGYLGLKQLNDETKAYKDMAQDALLAAELDNSMTNILLRANQYLVTRSPSVLDLARGHLSEMDSHLTVAQTEINAPERAELVDNIETQLTSFQQGLDKIVALYAERDKLVNDVLNEIGPKVRKNITSINESATSAQDYKAANSAGKVQEKFMLARLYANKYLLANMIEDAERAQAELSGVADALDQFSDHHPKYTTALSAIIADITLYQDAVKAVGALIVERNAIRDDQLYMAGTEINLWATQIKESAATDEAILAADIAAEFNELERLMVGAGIGAVVIALILGFLLGQGLSRPIERLSDIVKLLSDGNLDPDVPGRNRGDELGIMARAIEVLRDGARERRDLNTNMANQFENEVGEVLASLVQAGDELGATSQHMQEIASDNSNQATRGAKLSEQSSVNVQTVAASSEQLSASIQEINVQLRRAETITQTAGNKSRQAVEQMSGLIEQADRISQIVELITKIAEQTNLLALNATIESARAGDAGKGFAVVAQEVKALASQTSQSSDEIKVQISQLQQAAGTTGEELDSVQSVVAELTEIAANIAAAMEEQSATTQEIARSTSEVASGNTEVSHAVRAVEGSSNATLEATAGVAKNSEQLKSSAQILESRFSAILQGLRAS